MELVGGGLSSLGLPFFFNRPCVAGRENYFSISGVVAKPAILKKKKHADTMDFTP